MSAPLAFVDRLKRHVVGESLVRRNPLYYGRSQRIVDRLEQQDFEGRRRTHQELLARTLAAAQRTEYGKLVRGTDDPASWPLMDKELLRDRLEAFTTRREWFAAPANTGRPVSIAWCSVWVSIRAARAAPSCAATTCRIRAHCCRRTA
jgi:hypothetical protein